MADMNNDRTIPDNCSLPITISRSEISNTNDLTQISDPVKRDELLIFTQKALITTACIHSILCLLAHWHSSYAGYVWAIQDWELAIILTPLGGASIYSWLKKLKIPKIKGG